MSQTEFLLAQFASVRRYTNMVIEDICDDDWFRAPQGCLTHVAWQIGHLAFGQWVLALSIPRGHKQADEQLISAEFRKRFGRGSEPRLDPEDNPPVTEIIETFHGVHERVLTELANLNDERLSEPAGVEHPMFKTKLGALTWCVHHEYTHAGQISLLRRLLGYDVRW